MKAPLLRRMLLGVVPPASEPFRDGGLFVGGVVSGSMAERAGLAAGDVVLSVDGKPLRNTVELREATRLRDEFLPVEFVATRGGAKWSAAATPTKRPEEEAPESEVGYEQVTAADGTRLRTILTRPVAPGKHAAILYLQGITRDSVDFGGNERAAARKLIHGWAKAGFVTMRVERRGVGDSEGLEGGFDEEVSDYAAGLQMLMTDASVDPDALFVFGHSVGGMVAPFLENEGPRARLRGLIVMGASARRWSACVEESTRRQLHLLGWEEGAIEEEVARERREGFGIRKPEFHEELSARDVAGAFRRAGCDVLVVVGEFDQVVSEAEQEEIAEAVNQGGRRRGSVVRILGVDHAMTRHSTANEALIGLGKGVFADELVDVTSAWMKAALGG